MVIYNNENLPSSIKIAKVGTKVCRLLIKPYQKYPKSFKFGQRGKNLPNLVTLVEIQFEDFPIDAMTVEIDKVDLISRLKIIPFSPKLKP